MQRLDIKEECKKKYLLTDFIYVLRYYKHLYNYIALNMYRVVLDVDIPIAIPNSGDRFDVKMFF